MDITGILFHLITLVFIIIAFGKILDTIRSFFENRNERLASEFEIALSSVFFNKDFDAISTLFSHSQFRHVFHAKKLASYDYFLNHTYEAALTQEEKLHLKLLRNELVKENLTPQASPRVQKAIAVDEPGPSTPAVLESFSRLISLHESIDDEKHSLAPALKSYHVKLRALANFPASQRGDLIFKASDSIAKLLGSNYLKLLVAPQKNGELMSELQNKFHELDCFVELTVEEMAESNKPEMELALRALDSALHTYENENLIRLASNN